MIQKEKFFKTKLLFVLLFCLLLTSCQNMTPDQPTFTPDEPGLTKMPSPKPTSTRSPTLPPSHTPTTLPTLTPSPTPLLEDDANDLNFAGTPLPTYLAVLERTNLDLLHKLSKWGNGRANAIVLSPNGDQLVVATNLGVVLYNSSNFVQLDVIHTSQPTQTLAFSGDNQWIALAVAPDEIWVYPTSQDSPVAQLNLDHWDLPVKHQRTLLFTPDNAQLVHVVQSQTVLLIDRWDTLNWELLESFSVNVTPVAYVNPILYIAGILKDDRLVLQSLLQASESQDVPLAAAEPDSFWDQVQSILPGAQGDFLIINTGDETITRWQLLEESFSYRVEDFPYQVPDPCAEVPSSCLNQDREISWTCAVDKKEKKPIETFGLSPNELMVIISKRSGKTECRQAFDGAFMWEIDARYSMLTFSPNSEFFFGLLPDGTIEKRTTLDGSLIAALKEHPDQLFDIDVSPDGSILAAGYSDGWIRIINAWNGEMLGVLDGFAASLSFSSTGQQLAAGLLDGTVRIYELDRGTFYDMTNGHLAAVTDLAYFPGDQLLLTGSNDCTAGVWNLENRNRTLRLTPDHTDPFQISNIAIDPRQMTRYITGNQERGIFAIDETQGEFRLLLQQTNFRDVAVSSDGTFLAATGPGTWLLPLQPSPQTNQVQQLTSERLANGFALDFSIDDSVLAIATEQDLIFWSLPDGNEIASAQHNISQIPNSMPVDLEFLPDGALLAVASEDGVIHIFGIPFDKVE